MSEAAGEDKCGCKPGDKFIFGAAVPHRTVCFWRNADIDDANQKQGQSRFEPLPERWCKPLRCRLRHGEGGGLIVFPNPVADSSRDLIIRAAVRHKLPSIFAFRYYVTSGGLISYGIDTATPFRQAASYVDRILRGAKPADLPVQQPTKFELVVNLKTAKALGLTIPDSFLLRADEIIE